MKILFLTNSDALKSLATKNKNYEFEFVGDEKKLNKILQKKISSETLDYSLFIFDEIIVQTRLINFSNLPAISFFKEQGDLNQIHLLTKPIHITELFGKIEILLQHQQKKVFEFKDHIFDFETRFIKRNDDGQEMKLTEIEAKILIFFLERSAEEKTKTKLLQEVWNYRYADQMTDTGIVEVTINKLRKKLKEFEIDQQVSFKIT